MKDADSIDADLVNPVYFLLNGIIIVLGNDTERSSREPRPSDTCGTHYPADSVHNLFNNERPTRNTLYHIVGVSNSFQSWVTLLRSKIHAGFTFSHRIHFLVNCIMAFAAVVYYSDQHGIAHDVVAGWRNSLQFDQ